MQSAWRPIDNNTLYTVPQKEESKKLNEVAAAGGIVNAANAIQLAKTYKSSTKKNTKK
jgi:hypothetical protein